MLKFPVSLSGFEGEVDGFGFKIESIRNGEFYQKNLFNFEFKLNKDPSIYEYEKEFLIFLYKGDQIKFSYLENERFYYLTTPLYFDVYYDKKNNLFCRLKLIIEEVVDRLEEDD